MSDDRPIRVLVVDDSALMRRILTQLINAGRNLSVVGVAANGLEAIEAIGLLQPDVVTMDVEMPGMDGVQALKEIMSRHPLPVIMISSSTSRSAAYTVQCLELGAVDFVLKPGAGDSGDLSAIRYLIWQKIRSAAGITFERRAFPAPSESSALPKQGVSSRSFTRPPVATRRLVAIGSSTGGPRALLDVLTPLPAELPACVLIVQHMPQHFTRAMAERFDANVPLRVREAEEGDTAQEGLALIAPGGKHMHLDNAGQIRLSDEPSLWGVRPAVDYMMKDVADYSGAKSLGVILTGMGRDGTDGMISIRRAGGKTLAQDEESCVVFGMPRVAIEAGVVDMVLPLAEIGRQIIEWSNSPTIRKV